MHVLVSIDPGLKTSGTGIAVFHDTNLRTTMYTAPIKGEYSLRARIHPVIDVLDSIKDRISDTDTIEFIVEESFYQGVANKMHLRFMGVLDYFFPSMQHISPMTVKAKLGVSKDKLPKEAKAKDKKAHLKNVVKLAVRSRLSDQEATNLDWLQEDVVDAVAIGLAHLRR